MIRRRVVLGSLLVVAVAVAGVGALAGCRPMDSDGTSEVLAATATDIRTLDLLAINAAMGQYQKGDVEKIDAAVKEAVGSRWPSIATYVRGDIMVTVASSDTEVAYIMGGHFETRDAQTPPLRGRPWRSPAYSSAWFSPRNCSTSAAQ